MLNKLGQIVVKHRILVIIVWVLLLIPVVYGATHLHEHLQGEVASGSGTEMNRQENLLNTDFPQQSIYSVQLVMHSDEYTIDDPEYQALFNTYLEVIDNLEEAAAPVTYTQQDNQISADRKETFISIGLNARSFAEADTVGATVDSALRAVPVPSGFEVNLTGGPLFSREITRVSAEDGFHTEERVLPIAMIILVFAFGGFIAAGLPLVVGVFSVLFSLAILFVLSHYLQITSLSQNIVTMLGLGVGIDYSLLFVNRYREELFERGLDRYTAAINTVEHAGRTILYSGMVVSIGLAALLVPNVVFMRSLGLSGLLVVGMTVLIGLTLLPALLATIGEKINWPRRFSEWSLKFFNRAGFWTKWSYAIMKRPIFFSFVSIGVLLSLSLVALELKVWNPTIQIMPETLETRQGFEKILKMDPRNTFAPIVVTFETKDNTPIWQEKNVKAAYAFIRALDNLEPIRNTVGYINADQPLDEHMALYNTIAATGGIQNMSFFQPGLSLPFISEDETKGALAMFHEHEGYEFTDRDLQTITEIRAFRDDIASRFPNLDIMIGGLSAVPLEMKEAIFSYFPMIVGTTIVITYVLTMFSFGSILLPLKAVILNILSVTATYGCMILVFQRGFGAWLLGIEKIPGALLIVSPLILFCIIFGLSMDYEIFLINRIREEYDECGDPEEAIARGMEKTGGIITSAGLIMILVFAGFAFSRLIVIKEFGFGLAVAIFIDATIIRLMVVPALMKLFGHASWYLPGFLDIPFLRKLLKE